MEVVVNKAKEIISDTQSLSSGVMECTSKANRFPVELAVDDGRDSLTFVVFDKEMTKFTKQEAVILPLEETRSFQAALKRLMGTTSSSSETVVAAKLGMGGETTNPPGNKNFENTRKHR